MKNWLKILLPLVLIDYMIIRYCFLYDDPEPSAAIMLIFLVPGALIANLLIAGAFYILKKKRYSLIFLVNSLLASLMMYFLFSIGSQRYMHDRYESWTFKLSDKTYNVTRYKQNSDFSITESTNPGSSWSYMDGTYKMSNQNWILKTDSITMTITHNDYIIGFPNAKDSVKMKSIR